MERQTFVFLDGIRGLAAILVVTSHAGDFFKIWENHAYLAVDVFFILSGFVIALAYEQKLISGKLSFLRFVGKRVIRLYPAYITSLFLGFSLVVLGGFLLGKNLILWAGLSATLTVFFIPRISGSMMFSINPPYWSLFYEFLVNFLYAAIVPFLTTRLLVIILMSTATALSFISYFNGHLNIGWGNSSAHYAAGLSRSVFGILMGVLLYRIRVAMTDRLSIISPWFAVAIIIFVLLFPKIQGLDYLFDIVVVTVIFPLVIFIASQLKKSRFDSVMLMLGAASYPIYVLHYPIIKFLTIIAEALGHETIISDYAPFTGIALIVFLLVISVFMAKYIETPLRAWLGNLQCKHFPLKPAKKRAS